ncbi:hypothetical protein [Streptomyces sp. NPDC051997]|uniref:phage fiber-tail adaptor protein n=1 Tax=Streptomyces sp. NPDC051997 TaxID=3155611 RepID=UPI00341AD538
MSDRYIKDPSARLDYTWDWAAWLADVADTISSATVTTPDGLTADGAPVVGDVLVTQQISGGTVDETYTVVCQITTVGGRVDERSIYLTINNR